MDLKTIIEKSPKAPPKPPSGILGLDPGGTTGFAMMETDWTGTYGPDLYYPGQFKSDFYELENVLGKFIEKYSDGIVVVESYRLYPWKLQDQTWSVLQTPRFIGAIEYLLYKMQIPVAFQGAGQGKNFCTDDKLKEWELYQTGKRHANDAIRHICSWLIFGRDIEPTLLKSNHIYPGE